MSSEDRLNLTDAHRDATSRLLNRPLDAALLQEHTERVARSRSTQQQQRTESITVFQLGDERLAVPTEGVLRVRPRVDVHRIPHRSNARILGLCNIDGQLVLCVSLASVLDIPASAPQSAASARMVVIGEPAAPWAFGADAVVGVVSVSRDAFRDPPLTVERALIHYTAALVQVDGTQAAVLDTAALLAGFEAALR